jgi:hypothetical protein
MDSQLFDQFLEDSWSSEPCDSKPINTTFDTWPDHLWLNQYDPLACMPEDFQTPDDLESTFNLSTTSSPPMFELPSPILSSFSLSNADPFDQKPLLDLWVPTAIETTMAATSPSETSSPTSSTSNSSRAQPKRSPARTRKPQPRSENSSPKASCGKGKNSHNLIEKRYRNNINSKIQTLRDCIPSFRSKNEDESEDGESEGKVKCNKGIILEKAIQYIAELEREVERLEKENKGLEAVITGCMPRYLGLGARYAVTC